LGLEEACRWSYLVGGVEGWNSHDEWVRLDMVVREWVAQRTSWRKKVVGVDSVEALAREVLKMEQVLLTLPYTMPLPGCEARARW